MKEVLRLVGTKWNIGVYHPGFGNGGHRIPLSSQYVLEGAEKPEHLTILRDAVSSDSNLRYVLADRIVERGFKKVGILGLSYKGNLKVHALSPAIRIAKRLRERGVETKINDPYFTADEIMAMTGSESFGFPEGLREFDCVLIVAGHRIYRAITEARLNISDKLQIDTRQCRRDVARLLLELHWNRVLGRRRRRLVRLKAFFDNVIGVS